MLELLHLGHNIKQLRLMSGMSQTNFAEMIGCSRAQLSLLEHGKKIPLANFKVHQIVFLCEKYNQSVDDMLFKKIKLTTK